MKFFSPKWIKNYVPRDTFREMCSPLARVRYDAHVQMRYQSQRSLVAVHKSAFAKAALAETENCVGKNRRAFYVYREAERKQDTSFPSAKKERHTGT